MQGLHGWDILRACDAVKTAAREKGSEAGVKAATAIHKRASRVSFCQICLRLYGLQQLSAVLHFDASAWHLLAATNAKVAVAYAGLKSCAAVKHASTIHSIRPIASTIAQAKLGI